MVMSLRRFGIGLLALSCTLAAKPARAACESGQETTITQYGITFTFDTPTSCGQFANGDYWVAPASAGGKVTLTALAPDFNGSENGFEINPADKNAQGFDSRITGFDATLVPALPYAASGGQSVVKAISVDATDTNCRPCLQTAAVLTVLDAPPAGSGAGLFRPPYFGADKPEYSVSDMELSLLPSLPPVADAPTLDWVVQRFSRVQLDHKENWTGRDMHPVENMPDYGADIGRDSGDGALRLMLNDSVADKTPAAIAYVQAGIDLYHMRLGGVSWPPNGGHSSGRRLPIALAATLLGHDGMKAALAGVDRDTFGESGLLYLSSEANQVLFGQSCSEHAYWQNQTDQSGSRTCRDPYQLIDGGEVPGGSYQGCCNSQTWKGTALALWLMPDVRCVFDDEWFMQYVDRWVSQGAWAAPDTCAPSDGNPANEGVTYGPDGNGGCIPDQEPKCTAEELAAGATEPCIGRWPARHGASKDGGGYGSKFASALWTAERASASPGACGSVGGSGGGGGVTGGGSGGVSAGSGGVSGGGAAPAASAGDDDSGCGCRTSSQTSVAWWVALLALGLARRRRSDRAAQSTGSTAR